jgi:two-component system phosphate regulon sensor histidine kinase PhoR
VLQRHDATLDISSIQGRGSTFTCHFPPERLIAAEAARELDHAANA